jgi:chemotaxis protein MotA
MARTSKTSVGRRRLQAGSLLAVPAAFAVLLLAQYFEGGTVDALLHGAAALVVIGGTVAATFISYSPREVVAAAGAAGRSFLIADDDLTPLATTLVGLSVRAHRRGLLALDGELDAVVDPFLRHGLTLVVDGVDTRVLREVLGSEMRARDAQEDSPARVFEAAAGYAPIFGILGAALGLIQVMRNLTEPSALGAGIAVAFVATVYGLGIANMLLLPLAGRLREHATRMARRREVILEAMVALQQRTHPRLFAQSLRAMAPDAPSLEMVVAAQSRDVLHAVGGASDAPAFAQVGS